MYAQFVWASKLRTPEPGLVGCVAFWDRVDVCIDMWLYVQALARARGIDEGRAGQPLSHAHARERVRGEPGS